MEVVVVLVVVVVIEVVFGFWLHNVGDVDVFAAVHVVAIGDDVQKIVIVVVVAIEVAVIVPMPWS